jgi:hypothetical protein
MAAITGFSQDAVGNTWLPHEQMVRGGAANLATGQTVNIASLLHTVWYFSAVATGSVFAPGLGGLFAAAWQPEDDASTQYTATTVNPASGTITFTNTGITPSGYLHLLHTRGADRTGLTLSGTVSPASVASSFLPESRQGWIYGGATDLAASGVLRSTSHLKCRRFHVTDIAADQSLSTANGLPNGIFAVAWQPNASTTGCAVSRTSETQVRFREGVSGNPSGYLWCWSQH